VDELSAEEKSLLDALESRIEQLEDTARELRHLRSQLLAGSQSCQNIRARRDHEMHALVKALDPA